MRTVSLLRHPSTPCPYVREVTVEVDALSQDLCVLYYRIVGDIDQLQLPAQARSGPRDQLWKHTCLEAFLAVPDSAAYFELNFSPSSEWAVYRFDDYRKGMRPVQPAQPPRIVCRRREDRLEADVDVHLGGIEELAGGRALQLALTAVLEDMQGQISYWALAHPAGKPDFHHRDGFALSTAIDEGSR